MVVVWPDASVMLRGRCGGSVACLIEDFYGFVVFSGNGRPARSEAIAIDSDKLALPGHGELWALGFDHGRSLRSILSCTYFFREIPFG